MYNFYSTPDIIVFKRRKVRLKEHEVSKREMGNVVLYTTSVVKSEGKTLYERTVHTSEGNIKMDFE
jgi:hypothetical protein